MSTLTEHNTEAIFDSARASYLALNIIKSRLEEQESGIVDGIQFTVPELKDVARPIYPQETAFVIGHSKNGKSFLIKKVLYEETMKLFAQRQTDKVNVIITWEEPAEILAMGWMSVLSGISSTSMLRGTITRNQLTQLENNVIVKVGQYPIYIIGMSANRGADGRRHKVDLTMSGVDKCLNWIMNVQKLDIRVLALDYLQRIPQDGNGKREIHILRSVDWVKDLGFWTNASVFCATQAKQEALHRSIPMPQLYDSEWSANAAQSGDVAYSVWMPKNNVGTGNRIEQFGQYQDVNVTKGLQFLAILKQKGDEDGQVCAMEIQPDLLKWRMANEWYSTEWAREYGHRHDPRRPFV